MKKPLNLTEFLVEQVLNQQLKKRDNICKCERCIADMAAIALNNLPPRYVVTEKGEVLTRANILNNQISTDLLVEVSKAIEIVLKNPRH